MWSRPCESPVRPSAESGTPAARVIDAARVEHRTVATAESLTGGAVAAALVAVPDASAVFLGGIVAYSTQLKAELLGVDAQLLAERGTVDGDVAAAMATGATAVTGADIGLATTGAAGPRSHDGQPPGTVFIAVAYAGRLQVHQLALDGDRSTIRAATVDAVLKLTVAQIAGR